MIEPIPNARHAAHEFSGTISLNGGPPILIQSWSIAFPPSGAEWSNSDTAIPLEIQAIRQSPANVAGYAFMNPIARALIKRICRRAKRKARMKMLNRR